MTTVRVDVEVHKILQELSKQDREPMTAVLSKAVEQYRRQRVLERTNAAYEALRQDPVGWEEELEERREWEQTLFDGQEEEQ